MIPICSAVSQYREVPLDAKNSPFKPTDVSPVPPLVVGSVPVVSLMGMVVQVDVAKPDAGAPVRRYWPAVPVALG